KGDTLNGEVKINPKKEFDIYNKVVFKDASGVQKNYKPEKVKGYGFEGKHFIASAYMDDYSFYRVLSYGQILLLEVMYESMKMNEISYKSEYYIAKNTDKDYSKLKESKVKKQLTEFMKDNTDIVDNLGDDKFEIEKVTDVVNQYNNWARSK
ncbi:MAG: hypothetical protein ACXVPD_15945, partial [Bacteroidia bacterium]